MFRRDTIFTVHENRAQKDPADRLVLVREGFSFWAFLFTLFWLLANRLWIMSAVYAVLVVAIMKAGHLLGLGHAPIGILQFGLQVWLGLVAHDAQRAALARSGYTMTGVVCGTSQLMAQRRHYDRALAA